MNIAEEAIEVCRSAEQALRALMQKAIETGEYRHLPTLARMAEQLSTLGTRIAQPAPERPPAVTASEQKHRGRRRSRHRPDGKRRSAVSVAGVAYPRFERESDNLVKIGWSKNSKTEYEHRAPRRVVDALLRSILAAGQPGVVFTVEGLLPVSDPSDGSEIPGYQVYLALAWFRTEGLLQQHGREGYSLLVTSNLEKTIEERWNALLDRKQAKGGQAKS